MDKGTFRRRLLALVAAPLAVFIFAPPAFGERGISLSAQMTAGLQSVTGTSVGGPSPSMAVPPARVVVRAPGSRPVARCGTKGRPRSARKKPARCGAKASAQRQLAQMMSCPLPNSGKFHCVNVPLAGEFMNTCNGAMVTINSGSTWQFSVTVDLDVATGNVLVSDRSNWQNVSGFGTDGSAYSMNDTVKDFQTTSPIVGTTFTIEEFRSENQELVSRDPAKPNQIFHAEIHTLIEIDLNDPFNPSFVINEQISGPGLQCRG